MDLDCIFACVSRDLVKFFFVFISPLSLYKWCVLVCGSKRGRWGSKSRACAPNPRYREDPTVDCSPAGAFDQVAGRGKKLARG